MNKIDHWFIEDIKYYQKILKIKEKGKKNEAEEGRVNIAEDWRWRFKKYCKKIKAEKGNRLKFTQELKIELMEKIEEECRRQLKGNIENWIAKTEFFVKKSYSWKTEKLKQMQLMKSECLTKYFRI